MEEDAPIADDAIGQNEQEQLLTVDIAELQASEEKYRTLFQTMGQGYCELKLLRDAGGRAIDQLYLELNPAYERLIGIPVTEAKGRTASEVMPDLEPWWTETFARIVEKGEPEKIEHEVASLGRWFEVLTYPHGGDRLTLLYEDITDRKRTEAALRESEERQAFLLKLSDALRPLTETGEVERTATRLLGEYLKADRCFLSPVYEDGSGMCVREEFLRAGASSVLGDYTFAQFGDFVGPELHAGHTLAVEDVDALTGLDAAERASYETVGIGAYLLIPLVRDGRLAAFLTCNHQTPRPWSDADKAVAQQTADRLWTARERGRAEEALRESEARLSAAFESVPVGVAVIDMAGRIVVANPEYRRFMPSGVIPSRDPDRGWRWRAWHENGHLLDPDEFPGARTMRGEHVVPGQEMLYTDDAGREIWTRVASAPVCDLSGQVTGQASVISDIDALKRNAETLRESEERQAFLLELTDDLSRLSTPDEIAEMVGARVGDRLGLSGVLFADVDEARDQAVMHQAWNIADVPSVKQTFRMSDYVTAEFQRAGRANETVIICDTATDPRTDAEAYARLKVGAYVVIPFHRHGRWTHYFAVSDTAPRHWTPAEIGLFQDVCDRVFPRVERARAEAALRESEERFRSFAETSTDTLWIIDAATGQLEYLSPAYEAMWGEPRDAIMADLGHWATRVHPEDRVKAADGLAKLRSGERFMQQYRIIRPDGAVRYIQDTGFPIRENGKLRRLAGVAQDLTDRTLAEQATARAERRARTLMEGVPQLVWRAIDRGTWTWASPQWSAFTGQSEEDSRGSGWLDCVHPDDRAAAIAAWEPAEEAGVFETEYRLRRRDGDYVWFGTRASPVRDDAGDIVEWLGTSTDIDVLRQLQERQGVMVAELQHRTRNLIGVVRSLSDRTLDDSNSLDDFQDRFGRRLAALSRVQGLLSNLSAGERVMFSELLRTELAAMGASDGLAHRVELDGPEDVPLRSATVQTFALALHELATNAVKYGALSTSNPDGRLIVRWNVEVASDGKPPRLHVEWRESGVAMPEVSAPTRGSGYGRELIERALPYQLKAKTSYEFGRDGVRCTILVPVSGMSSGE